MDVIDVLCMLSYNAASNDTGLILKELRKQTGVSFDTVILMKTLFADAVKFPTVCLFIVFIVIV